MNAVKKGPSFTNFDERAPVSHASAVLLALSSKMTDPTAQNIGQADKMADFTVYE